MTYDLEPHRATIQQLYLVQDKTLKEVRQQIERTHRINPGIRCLRNHISRWGILKKGRFRTKAPNPNSSTFLAHQADCLSNRQPSRSFSPSISDSGYGSESLRRASSATSASTPWSDNASIGDVSGGIANPTTNGNAFARASTLRTYSRGSSHLYNDTLAEVEQEGVMGSGSGRTYLPGSQADGGSTTLTASPLVSSPSNPLPLQSTRGEPWLKYSGYSSGHSPRSRCRMAQNNFAILPVVGLISCQYCEMTEIHCLATKNLDKRILVDQLALMNPLFLNKCDIFGNSPSHFLAGSAPTMEQITAFSHAGVDLFRKNSDGETFLHVLDPANLVSHLPDLLTWFEGHCPGFLIYRTHHGKTVLHCLLENPCFLDTSKSFHLLYVVLAVFQSAKNDLKARCNQGWTAMDVFYTKWMQYKTPDCRSSEEWELLKSISTIFDVEPILLKFDAGFTLVPLCGNMTSEQRAPTGRDSGDLTLLNLRLKDEELLQIIDQASQDPRAQDYRARNALHCLAVISRLWRAVDAPEPFHVRKQVLEALLKLGVAVNEFDAQGSTPLHCFLSFPRRPEEDSTIAMFVKIMVQDYGANIHMRDRNGDDALHLACKAGRVSCTEILLSLGANVDTLNYQRLGVIEEASRVKKISSPEEKDRIQQCINRVRRANGFEDPIPEEDLLYSLSNSYPAPTR